MPATIQGYRPDPRIRQRALAELRRLYGEVVHAQQGTIVFVAGEAGSGRRATLQALREALRESRSHPTVIARTLAGGTYQPLAMARTDYDQAMDVLGKLLAVAEQVRAQDVSVDAVGRPMLRQGVAKDRQISIENADMRHGRKSAGQLRLLDHCSRSYR